MTRLFVNILCISFMFFPVKAFACTMEEAFNKKFILDKVQGQMMKSGNQLEAILMLKEYADVGVILAQKNYKLACEYYDKIAIKYKIDFNEHKNNTATYQDYVKADKSSKCNMGKTVKWRGEIRQKLMDKVILREIEQSVVDEFMKDDEGAAELAYVNPVEYCLKLRELTNKFTNLVK